MAPKPMALLVLAALHLLSSATAAAAGSLSIGVNYGGLADNLPPPAQVAAFLKDRTFIDRVKLFDANPDFIRAFAGTGIALAITAANADIPALAKPAGAAAWVAANVVPFHPATNITLVLAGNEIMATADRNLIAHLVPAMRALSAALADAGLRGVRVSTPHSLGILSASEPPSSGRFRRVYDSAIFAPMLQFHRDARTPFVVNPYPYFGYTDRTLDFALFRPNAGVFDAATGINYTNMFAAQLDAVHSAMKRVGYGDVEIAVGETGWPSAGEPGQAGVTPGDAAAFNGNVVRFVNSGLGTPLMPGRRFETYLFALFNEDLKPGPVAERNFGLFAPDFTTVYESGILRDPSGGGPQPSSPAAPAPTGAGRTWCVPAADASESALLENINYACSNAGVDCSPIQTGGACFDPDTPQAHAAYAMNTYYQNTGRHDFDCDFASTGVTTTTDPSYGTCKYSTSA